MSKSKKSEPPRRCPAPGCKTRLDATGVVVVRCGKCAKEVCKEHQYPVDHDCKGPAPAAAGTSSASASATAAGQGPGGTAATAASKPTLLVVANRPKTETQPATTTPAAPSTLAPTASAPPPTAPAAAPSLASVAPDALAGELLACAGRGRWMAPRDAAPRVFLALEVPPATWKEDDLHVARLAVQQAVAGGAALVQGLGELFEREPKSEEEPRFAACMMVLGMAAAYATEDKDAVGACDKIVSTCLHKAKGDATRLAGARALAECLSTRASPSTNALCQTMVDTTWHKLLSAGSEDRALALVYAGYCQGLGLLHRARPEVLRLLSTSTKASDLSVGLGCLQALAEVAQRALEPYCMADTVGMVFSKYASGDAVVKRLAVDACRAMTAHCLGPVGVGEFADACERGCRDTNWRVKEVALLVIPMLASSSHLETHLPGLVAELARCVVDSKREVSTAASLALDAVGARVSNPETKRMMPFLLHALKKPDEGTDKCLDELMEATFVNALNSTSVALIVPVVLRALREGSADLKRRGATATGNVCTLVSDVKDVAPFYGVLKVELDKLKEHSNPPVRKAAVTAATSLEKAVGGHPLKARRSSSSQQQKSSPRMGPTSPVAGPVGGGGMGDMDAATARRDALKMAREVLREDVKWKEDDGTVPAGAAVALDEEGDKRHLFRFALVGLAWAGARILQTPPVTDSATTSAQLREMLGKGMVTFPPADLDKLCEGMFARIRKVRAKAFDAMDALALSDGAGGVGSARDEVLVHIPNLILAFASRVLLNRTSITLKKRHRYGIVGKIGVGKTTFAARLAKGDIEGFPASVKTYLVLHEVVSHQNESALMYMGGSDEAREVLGKVGFASPDVLVSALSGGWRMRLAIAKSMLARADLLILDEPTNHVDVDGVKWLADYLVHLDTTVVVVSHDYDFLGLVCTDVLHINNQRLEAFGGSFSEFQVAFPDVVAALPRMKRDEGGGGDEAPSASTTPAPSSSTTPVPPTTTATAGESSDAGTAIFELLAKSGAGDPAVSQRLAELQIPTIVFPDPGKLEGVSSKGKPIMTATDVCFAYPAKPDVRILNHVTCRISLNSRVAMRGANGQGKSTLLKLMVGELELNPERDTGSVWKHHNLRVAYVAQHAAHHLESSMDITPVAYLQRRYHEGRDKERGKMVTLSLTPEEKRITEVKGEICGILSRVQRGKQLYYEIDVAGRRKPGQGGGGRETGRPGEDRSARDYRSLAQLEALNKPHVIKLVRMFDQELQYESSGMSIRPVTQVEILKHLADFGISDDFAERKIRWLSGGQRSRLVLAAAMWHKPHLVALDEPTNFLDAETLAVLTHCLRTFKGAVLTISHHYGFINALCNEAWDLQGGNLTVTVLRQKLVDQVFGGSKAGGGGGGGGGGAGAGNGDGDGDGDGTPSVTSTPMPEQTPPPAAEEDEVVEGGEAT